MERQEFLHAADRRSGAIPVFPEVTEERPVLFGRGQAVCVRLGSSSQQNRTRGRARHARLGLHTAAGLEVRGRIDRRQAGRIGADCDAVGSALTGRTESGGGNCRNHIASADTDRSATAGGLRFRAGGCQRAGSFSQRQNQEQSREPVAGERLEQGTGSGHYRTRMARANSHKISGRRLCGAGDAYPGTH